MIRQPYSQPLPHLHFIRQLVDVELLRGEGDDAELGIPQDPEPGDPFYPIPDGGSCI